ncbi:unnamed protein product [Cylicostephanus goldi]|uniref:Uncharacterized protein n=1 Tax=Cylicostephanus goldi TaxID=71465 RepID=A0A3P6QZ46_CYLGO|nr:unnamed protein product [Cylicostephanus goldi]
MKKKRTSSQAARNFLQEAAEAVKTRTSALEVEKSLCKFQQYGQFVTTYLKGLPDNVVMAKMSLMTNNLLEQYIDRLEDGTYVL